MNIWRSGIHRIPDTISYPGVCLLKLFKNYSNFKIDKRSNLEHYVEQAATLPITAV